MAQSRLMIAIRSHALAGLAGTVATGAPVGQNLVGNPGFEAVDASDQGPHSSVRLLAPWISSEGDNDDNFAYPYAEGYSGSNPPADAGLWHYTGGFGTETGDALIEQTVDLSTGESATLIESGLAAFDLSAYFSSYRAQSDACAVTVEFADTDGDPLGYDTALARRVGGQPFVTGLKIVGGQRVWEIDTTRWAVPFGAATAVVRLVADAGGTNHDGYVDLIDLRIIEASAPARVGVNLVGNPGFESIDTGESGPFGSSRISGGWEDPSGDADDNWAYAHDQGYSGLNAPPLSGSHYYTGGFGTTQGETQIRQSIGLTGGEAGDLIATGNAHYDLSAYFSSYREQPDASIVRATFVDAGGTAISSDALGGSGFLSKIPAPDGQREWASSRATGTIPLNTVSVLIEVLSDEGTANHDGYVDQVSFKVTSNDGLAIRVGPFLQDAEPDSVWVGWETMGDAPSRVEFGETEALGQVSEGSSIPGLNGSRIHHAPMTGLEPDKVYWYRVGAGEHVSEIARFRTPPARGSEDPFRFVAYSDTQWGPDTGKHTEVINEGVIGFTKKHFGSNLEDELAFSVIPGDLVNVGSNYSEWKDQFFDEEQNLSRHIPLYPAPGNHEQDTHWYFDYFKLPENGTPGYLEHWWYKDYANVRVIGLDTNSGYRIQAQLDWLDGVLDEAAGDDAIDFVFAHFHHPHKTPAWTPGNTDYSGEIVQRLEAFSTESGKPSVHFFGHTHAYERGQSRDHHHLWVDVSAGEGDLAWWGEYDIEDYPEFQKTIMDWGFVLMEVEGGENPSFRLRRVSRGNQYDPKDNEVVDDITIRTRNGKPQTPVAETPAPGSIIEADAALLRGSVFVDWDGDAHLATRVQITTTEGDYTSPLYDEWFRFENWFAPPDATSRDNGWYSVDTRAGMDVREFMPSGLEPETEYFWRVRYRDSALAWSDWSAESSFRTRGTSDCAADLAEPIGVLDLSDVVAFIDAFVMGSPAADLAQPYYVLDLADVGWFASSFSVGCP